MLFSSITFLYAFLPVTLLVYFAVPKRYLAGRNYVLLIVSAIFYAWGGPGYLIIMTAQIIGAWLFGLAIEYWAHSPKRRLIFVLSLCFSLSMLLFYKYTDFFIGNLNAVFGSHLPLLKLVLPVGISFYTFQILSYLIDLYRQEIPVQRNLGLFATYVALFPPLIAGPIIRYADISAALTNREHSLEDFAVGAKRFVVGLGKKVIIANTMGNLVATLGGENHSSSLAAWVFIVAFALQIYFDFSAYSDMAIGLGRIFGFKFKENFNYPYIARSITEFWRRWHMSLSSWFRDYVYFPLGGSRVSAGRLCLNLIIVWGLTGFWHGAAWNFITWGCYFAVLLMVEKFFLKGILERVPDWLARCYTLLVVLISWVLFDARSMGGALDTLGVLFGAGGIGADSAAWYYLRSYAVPLLLAIVGSTPLPAMAGKWLAERFPKLAAVAEPIFLAGLLLICTAFLVDSSFNPFIYFRF